MTHALFTDGGSRGNPGPAAIGGIIFDAHKQVVAEYAEAIGITTNNQAEYRSLIQGLRVSIHHGITKLSCYLDSELLVRQINGQYRVKDTLLKPLFHEVERLSGHFERITFAHIPRERNARADALVNKALDS